jgi:hypothetical protein
MIKVVVHMEKFFKPCSEEFHEVAKSLTELAKNEAEYSALRHECEIHENKEACDLSLYNIERRTAIRRHIENNSDDFVKCLGRMLELAVKVT